MKTRAVFKIDVTPLAVKKVSNVSERTGVTQIAVMSNLVKWFADQPKELQLAILDDSAAGRKVDVTSLVLKQMAK